MLGLGPSSLAGSALLDAELSLAFGRDPGPARIALAPEHEATAWVARGRRWRPGSAGVSFPGGPWERQHRHPAQPDGTPCSEFLCHQVLHVNGAPSPSAAVTSGSLYVGVCPLSTLGFCGITARGTHQHTHGNCNPHTHKHTPRICLPHKQLWSPTLQQKHRLLHQNPENSGRSSTQPPDPLIRWTDRVLKPSSGGCVWPSWGSLVPPAPSQSVLTHQVPLCTF